jgi:hypothetical protein
MSKKWYEKIGRPLGLLNGWGMDEEYLSAATWMAGGRCILLDYDAAHLFRSRPSFNTDGYDAILRMLNRARFFDLLPAPKAETEQMEIALNLNLMFHNGNFQSAYAKDKERKEVKEAVALWHTWDWTKLEPWIDRAPAPLAIRQEAAVRRRTPVQIEGIRGTSTSILPGIPTTQMRSMFICPQCGGSGTFRQRHTETVGAEIRQYGRCKACHRGGIKITRDSFEKIHWNG